MTEIIIKPFQPVECQRPLIYQKKLYDLPVFGRLIGMNSIELEPAQLHAAVIAMFAALIAPFGGFFASGLKRGLKIKDFADSIPGHGGFADRFDCHFVISFIVYFYLTQYVYKDEYSLERVFDYIGKLEEKDKFMILQKLQS